MTGGARNRWRPRRHETCLAAVRSDSCWFETPSLASTLSLVSLFESHGEVLSFIQPLLWAAILWLTARKKTVVWCIRIELVSIEANLDELTNCTAFFARLIGGPRLNLATSACLSTVDRCRCLNANNFGCATLIGCQRTTSKPATLVYLYFVWSWIFLFSSFRSRIFSVPVGLSIDPAADIQIPSIADSLLYYLRNPTLWWSLFATQAVQHSIIQCKAT